MGDGGQERRQPVRSLPGEPDAQPQRDRVSGGTTTAGAPASAWPKVGFSSAGVAATSVDVPVEPVCRLVSVDIDAAAVRRGALSPSISVDPALARGALPYDVGV